MAVLKRYGSRYKVTWNASTLNSGITVEKRARGSANDEKLDCNIRRAKNKIKELAMCNDWQYFVTFTLNKDKQDRYDIKAYIKNLGQMIRDKNKNRLNKITYLLIPEQHKDGAWHMHGFINGLMPGEVCSDIVGTRKRKVYKWIDYQEKFGFCDMEEIEDKEKASSYITKYVTKDMSRSIKEINAKSYYNSRGLNVAEVIKKGSVSAKYSPQYEKNIDGRVVYSEMMLPLGISQEQAISYLQYSECINKFQEVISDDGELLDNVPLEWI